MALPSFSIYKRPGILHRMHPLDITTGMDYCGGAEMALKPFGCKYWPGVVIFSKECLTLRKIINYEKDIPDPFSYTVPFYQRNC